jgi:hypothetical protein
LSLAQHDKCYYDYQEEKATQLSDLPFAMARNYIWTMEIEVAQLIFLAQIESQEITNLLTLEILNYLQIIIFPRPPGASQTWQEMP